MRSKNRILLIIAAAFFSAGIWSGCTVGFDANQSGVFPCETKDDCIKGFECVGDTEKVCQEITVDDNNGNAPPCDQTGNPPGDIDLDNDGYGTGSNRTACPEGKKEEDCNDDDPNINPGAAEKCNGADDNCDGVTDEQAYSCETIEDCPSPPDDLDYLQKWSCDNNTCVMKNFQHNVQLSEEVTCGDIDVTCNLAAGEEGLTYTFSGQSYAVTEGPYYDECR